ncbi:MmgE/PrpD family protein [Chloroflexota bacterium]
MENKYTATLAKFSANAKFYDLSAKVIHETKRIFLDVVGCALGAVDLKKGSIAVELAKYLGGKSGATILGTGGKVSVTSAAFANAELMHSLDFCPVSPPGHVAPFVTTAPLALAEAAGVSGRELILALALANEVASRVGVSLGSKDGREEDRPSRSYGFSGNTLGAAVGAAKILKLDPEKTADVLGIAGYYAPLPAYTKWLYTPGNGMAKYGPAGWTAQAGVTAALIAERGYQGDKSVLDGDYGFEAMNGVETRCQDKITDKLGKEWLLLKTTYKYWPCHDIFGSCLDAFFNIIEENDLRPEEIDKVVIKGEGYGVLPRFQTMEITSHVDAQMNLPYSIAVAAHRVKIGPEWQAESTLSNPGIRDFMKKVSYEPYPRCEEAHHQELVVEKKPYINRRPAYAEVWARGKSFIQKVEYANWLSRDNLNFRASDADLADKFRANAGNLLRNYKVEKAIETINNLESVDDVTQLMKLLTA